MISSDFHNNINRSEPNVIHHKKILHRNHEESAAVIHSTTMTSHDDYFYPSTISSLRTESMEHRPMTTAIVAATSNQFLNTTLIDRSTRDDTMTERIHMDLLPFSTISEMKNRRRQQQQITNIQPTSTFPVSEARYNQYHEEQ